MQIEDVFGAFPKSVLQYLCENGQGLYVPAYQRQYSWDKSKIERLVEDICHGFAMLISHEDAITFLGTIIAIHDTQYSTVNPLVKGDVPSRVMTIIDGQQRLTTLLILNTLLHDSIRVGASAIRDSKDVEKVWLFEECMKVAGLLAKTFEEDKDYGDDAFRYYPRMIRAYDDSWSRKKDKAEYKSPVGRYLHLYGQHYRKTADKHFKFELPANAAEHSKHKKLGDGRKALQTMLSAIASEFSSELEFPSYDRMLGSKSFQETMLKAEFPEEVRNVIQAEGNKAYKELLRLVLFANFVLTRVAVTTVTAKNEDYAFDMFESLNTTGEPLTAFETFKPRVIHFEGLEKYEKTNSYEYMHATETYLEGFTKTDDKQDATSRLIVAFASAERGEKLSKRLSDQRRFFKECFDKLGDDAKRAFIRHLSHTALFIQHSWDALSKRPSIQSAEDAATDEVMLCLDAMRAIKHSIVLGPLVRFYSEIRKADTAGRKIAVDEFVEATRSVAAFSTLWRASRRGTENIDMHYRNLMANGCPAVGMPPLCRVASDGVDHPAPKAELLKAALRHVLKVAGKVETKDDWVKAAARLPAYQNQRDITRLLLLAAAHDSAADKAEPGLTVAGRAELLPMLNFKHWHEDASQTVEHVAPGTQSGGWDEQLYEDPETIHCLGNLTLLPRSENASLSNGSWDRKRLIYKILSAETADELDPLLNQAKANGIDIGLSTAELLAESKYLPMTKAISCVDGAWTLDLVQKRSKRIAELAWSRIAPWLGLQR